MVTMDVEKTKVIFRKAKSGKFKGDIIAFMPELPVYIGNRIVCYEHIGQHGEAGISYYHELTVPAKEEEYKDFKSEMESIGYNVDTIKGLYRYGYR